MSQTEKIDKLFKLLNKAFADDEVKVHPELVAILLQAGDELAEDQNPTSVAEKLSRELSQYWLLHRNKFPIAAAKLYLRLRPMAKKAPAVCASALMIPIRFH